MTHLELFVFALAVIIISPPTIIACAAIRLRDWLNAIPMLAALLSALILVLIRGRTGMNDGTTKYVFGILLVANCVGSLRFVLKSERYVGCFSRKRRKKKEGTDE